MKHHLLKPLLLVASARAKQRTAHFPLAIILLQLSLRALPATEFHVAITGSDASPGTQAAPLRTIQRAADLAQPGDTVTVHAGVYREHVNPPRGGESDTKRIVYQTASGEQVVITGSEAVKKWEKVQDDVWKATLPNTIFDGFNPFAELIAGDWFDAKDRSHHAGAVYLNGDWLTEAVSLEEVLKPMTATPLWFASVDPTRTFVWAQFKDVDPNAQQVEVNVRRSLFYPDKPGRNYITVRGFTLRNAATPWAPPTVEQIGLIGVHWSKGWIIENNDNADLFVEASHGLFVVDNNLFLSPKSMEDDSQGGAYAHNLIAGGIDLCPTFFDGRKTPFHKAHSTEVVALHDNPSGDNHYYNNLFMRSGSLEKYDQAHLPMWMDGNVFFQGAKSSKHERDPINRSASDPGLTLVEKNDGFYLTMTIGTALGSERPSQPVTSARLGKASISACAFENPDGSPITIGTDYFGKPRNTANPTPGPFEAPGTGTLTMKVWPLASTRETK